MNQLKVILIGILSLLFSYAIYNIFFASKIYLSIPPDFDIKYNSVYLHYQLALNKTNNKNQLVDDYNNVLLEPIDYYKKGNNYAKFVIIYNNVKNDL